MIIWIVYFQYEFGNVDCITAIVIVIIWYLFVMKFKMVPYQIIKNLITIETLEYNP